MTIVGSIRFDAVTKRLLTDNHFSSITRVKEFFTVRITRNVTELDKFLRATGKWYCDRRKSDKHKYHCTKVCNSRCMCSTKT